MNESSDEKPEYDESENSDNEHILFGYESMRNYSGSKMEKLDECFSNDQDEGHMIFIPEMLLSHRYQVKTMIGRGTFCLVWMAYDHLRREMVAIKVLKDSENEGFDDEFVINAYLSRRASHGENVVLFYDVFYYGNHCCLVFELCAQNILTFVNYFSDFHVRPPLALIKKIAFCTLKGLDFMHRCGVIHTDLKPENVLGTRPLFPYEPYSCDDHRTVFHCLEDDPISIEFKLADLGNSCFINSPTNDLIQTRQYRSPEVMLGIPYDTSADIWSLGCMVFELVTRNHLFDPNSELDLDDNQENRPIFDSIQLSMIQDVIGMIPDEWAKNGMFYQDLYNECGALFRSHEKEMLPIIELLMNYGIQEDDAEDVASFIQPMLTIVPSQRPTASELLESPWLHLI